MVITFSLALSGGMMLVLAGGRPAQIASRFLQMAGFLALTPLACVVAWLFRQRLADGAGNGDSLLLTAVVAGAVAIMVVLLAPLAARIPAAFRVTSAIGGAFGTGAACLSAVAALGTSDHPAVVVPLVVIGQIVGAALLGSITVSWLIGHAYLTATKMTIAPFRRFVDMLAYAVAARALFLIASLTVGWFLAAAPGAEFLAQWGHAWLVLFLRIGFGLVGVGAMAYMARSCVKLRSTQSATGILYFASIFAYIGELAGLQLVIECGWPI